MPQAGQAEMVPRRESRKTQPGKVQKSRGLCPSDNKEKNPHQAKKNHEENQTPVVSGSVVPKYVENLVQKVNKSYG